MDKKTIALIATLMALLVGTIAFTISGGVKSKPVGNATSTATTTAPLTLEQRVSALEQKTIIANQQGQEIPINQIVIQMANILQNMTQATTTK